MAAILPKSRSLRARLPTRAAGDDGDGVGGAAIDLYEDDETLAVGVESAVGKMAGAGVVDAETREGEHGYADAEDLAGAEMAVGDFGFVEEGVEGYGHRAAVGELVSGLGLGSPHPCR